MDRRKLICLVAFFAGIAALVAHVRGDAIDPDYVFGCLSASVLATWGLWMLRRA